MQPVRPVGLTHLLGDHDLPIHLDLIHTHTLAPDHHTTPTWTGPLTWVRMNTHPPSEGTAPVARHAAYRYRPAWWHATTTHLILALLCYCVCIICLILWP